VKELYRQRAGGRAAAARATYWMAAPSTLSSDVVRHARSPTLRTLHTLRASRAAAPETQGAETAALTANSGVPRRGRDAAGCLCRATAAARAGLRFAASERRGCCARRAVSG
jgi:hypothetical protein